MKTLFLWAICCLLATPVAWAQTAWQWAQSFPEVQVNDVATNAAGDVFVTGSFQTPVTFSSPYFKATLTPVGTRDILVARLDAQGRVKWARQVGGNGATANGTALALDGAGSAYVAGTFADDTLTANTGPAPLPYVPGSLGNVRTCVLKLALSTGTVEWSRQGGGGAPSSRDCIAADVAAGPGGCYVVGHFGTSAMFEQTMLSGLRQASAYVASYSPTGTLRWVQASSIVVPGPAPISAARAQAAAVATDDAGDCYLTGRYVFCDFQLGGLALPYADNNRLFVTRLAAATGAAHWTRSATAPAAPTGLERTDGTGIAVLGGACYVGGTAQGTLRFGSSYNTGQNFQAPTARGYLARYQLHGGLRWVRPLPDATSPVKVTAAAGRILAASGAVSAAGGAPVATVWAHRPGGVLLWSTQASGGSTTISGLAVAGPSVCLAGAYSGTVSFGPRVLTAPADAAYGYLAQLRTGLRAAPLAPLPAPPEAPALLAYPNPATDELRLQLAEGTRSVALLDQFGRVVRQQTVQALQTSLDVRELTPGVYWLRYENANGTGSLAVEIKR